MDSAMSSDFHETEELVRRGNQGDSSALEELFSRHRGRLRRMVELRLDWRLASRLDTDDVLQEAYLEAARRLDEYLAEPKVPFFVWLRFLTEQKLAHLHRRHLGTLARDVRREVRLQWRPVPTATTASLAAQLLGNSTSPSEHVIRAEMKIKLEEALDAMDKTDREVLILRHYEELTYQEIAHELGIERSTATKRYFRALKRIKQILGNTPSADSGMENRYH